VQVDAWAGPRGSLTSGVGGRPTRLRAGEESGTPGSAQGRRRRFAIDNLKSTRDETLALAAARWPPSPAVDSHAQRAGLAT